MFQNQITRLAALAALLFAPVLAAQSLTVTPNPLTQGGTANLSYTNAALAGQLIEVVVTGGLPVVQQVVAIQLDGAGHGTGSWKVANWSTATFTAPGCAAQQIRIQ